MSVGACQSVSAGAVEARGITVSELELIGSFELPGMGAKIQTLVLWKTV